MVWPKWVLFGVWVGVVVVVEGREVGGGVVVVEAICSTCNNH